jgi:hypothetical protein
MVGKNKITIYNVSSSGEKSVAITKDELSCNRTALI